MAVRVGGESHGRSLRLLQIVILGGLFAGAFHPFFILSNFKDRGRIRETLRDLPYSKTPGLRRFMLGVRERTRSGDRIAIFVPMKDWSGGYGYAYARSQYLLAGREVLAVIGPDQQVQPANIDQAGYVASWHMTPALAGFREVWRSDDGVLLRRVP